LVHGFGRRKDRRMSDREFMIREKGRNGSVVVQDGRLIRTLKKRLGRSDEQVVMLKSIHEVHLDRNMMRADTIKVTTSGATYVWKCRDAEDLHRLIQDNLPG
jgi:hypothetical protein